MYPDFQEPSPILLRNARWVLLILGLCFSFIPSLKAEEPKSPIGAWAGPPELLFDSDTSACEPLDIPDANPRAFRDADGQVHLFATHYTARAMVGPSLNAVRHNCDVVYRSPQNADPSQFLDRNWLDSFFTADGKVVVALVHSEYQAWTHPGKCLSSPAGRVNCWWNSITMAVSKDGGFAFEEPPPPRNLVATAPYRFDGANQDGPVGYLQPTNIVQFGHAYYAIMLARKFRAQKYGACLMRSDNLLDPTSWRGWDGQGFTVRFVDPYRVSGKADAQPVCEPLGNHAIYAPGSINYYSPQKLFVATEFTSDGRFGPKGLYMTASKDLVHWSEPNLIATTVSMIEAEGPGHWDFGYFGLLDPTSKDRNFLNISDAPYVYYVRFNRARGNLSRDLVRRQVRLRFPQD